MKIAIVIRLASLGLSMILPQDIYAANYSEQLSGDLSNNPLAPAILLLEDGSNIVTGEFGGGDPAEWLLGSALAGGYAHGTAL